MTPGKTLLSSIRVAAAALAIGLAPCCPYRLSQAQQNPFGQFGEALKQAAEKTVSALLDNDLPLRLDANAVYPTVSAPPGGPFAPQPLSLNVADLDRPFLSGDYTLNVLAFCTEYSVHRPGAGVAYRLGPLQGKAASVIGDLLWRGTLAKNVQPQQLQAVSWAIQSGLRYGQMPRTYQSVIDNVIPEHRSQLNGDFFQSLEDAYNSLAKGTRLPPLQQMLTGMGKSGQLALSADRQRQALLRQKTSDQLKEQTLFAGQESAVYTPVRAEQGPWTERIPDVAYVRFLIVGGNLARNNIMQIRILSARGQRAGAQGPHLMYASFVATPAASAAMTALGSSSQTETMTATTPANLTAGTIGCAVGQGAQCLIPVPAANSASAAPECVSPCVGHVQSLQGKVQVTRGGTLISLKAEDQIDMNDKIETSKNSKAVLAFSDNTQMTLGGETRVQVDSYVYDPSQKSGMAYQLMNGAFRYVSSLIGKHDNDPRIDTPVGTIGIRGTEFVVSHGPAGQDEIDLIRRQVDITPKALTQATTFKGPVKIMLNDNSATGSPLSQAEYDAIQARLSPAQPGAPLM